MKSVNPLTDKLRGYHGFYALFLIFITGMIVISHPHPIDDFNRHIRYLDYAKLGGYAYMFPFSKFQVFKLNPWYGFDILAGLTKNYFGSDTTIAIFEVMMMSLFIIALLINIKEHDNDSVPVICFLIALFLTTQDRITLIRPCILMAILFLIAIKGKGIIAGLIYSIITGILYYLFWFYTFPILIVHILKGNKKFALGTAIGTGIAIAVWTGITDGRYLTLIYETAIAGGKRNGILIEETLLPIVFIFSPMVFLLIAGAVVTYYREKDIDKFGILILVTTPLIYQVRYFIDITLPLLFLYVINHNRHIIFQVIHKYKTVVFPICMLGLVIATPQLATHKETYPSLKTLNLPENATVFTDDMRIMFSMIYHNPKPIHLIPTVDPAFSSKDTQIILKTLRNKIPDNICDYFKSHEIQYIASEKDFTSLSCVKPYLVFSSPFSNTRLAIMKIQN